MKEPVTTSTKPTTDNGDSYEMKEPVTTATKATTDNGDSYEMKEPALELPQTTGIHT